MKIIKNSYNKIRSGFKIIFVLIMKILFDSTLLYEYRIIRKKIINGNSILSKQPTVLVDILGVLYSIILNGFMILLIIILWKFIEKKRISQMGLPCIKAHYKELIIGLFIGVFSISLVEEILLLFNTVIIAEPAFEQNSLWIIVRGLIIAIFISVASEMFYRGYVMSLLRKSNKYLILSISVALEVMSLLLIPKLNLLVVINSILLALLSAYMFMKSRNIWMPIGFNMAWNYMQSYIYGFKNGGVDGSGIYQLQHIKNNLLNGGNFGPQAGIVVTGIICLLFVFVYLYYKDNSIDEFMLED